MVFIDIYMHYSMYILYIYFFVKEKNNFIYFKLIRNSD